MYFKQNTHYDDFNLRIAQLVAGSKRVLDVGCATGKLLQYLKQNKSCEVAGIEIDPAMASQAKERCPEIACLDIEAINGLPLSKGYFDAIIFADVLEHLKRPDQVLKKIAPYLRQDGTLLISLPNVAFFTIRLGLFFGNFNYAEYGVLDKSHLRFFTLKTAKRLIEGAGFRITRIEGYNQVRARFFFLRPLGKIFKNLFATNFIIQAVLAKA